MRTLTISPAEVAERRMHGWVEAAGVEPLEADWVSITFELKRLRNSEGRRNALLSEALEAMINLAPRVKNYDGCFDRMAGGFGGKDCKCTACKIRREIDPANSR